MTRRMTDELARANDDLCREISERKRTQEELDRFFTLSLDMLCIANRDGYFKRVSPAFTRTLGWSMEELLARPFIDFVHPDDHSATLEKVEQLVIDGQPVLHFENRYRHKDGSWRTLSWTSVSEPDGTMYAAARDVTERQLAEERVRRANEKLAAANKELEAFSYSVSHDLRAPLRHINGFASLLRKHAAAELNDKGQQYLTRISEAAKHMEVLIDDLLQFSQIGRTDLRPLPVRLDQLVCDVLTGFWQETDGRNIDWAINDLPHVRADAMLLRQVFVNLLSNAVKYTQGRDPARIEIGSLDRDQAAPVISGKEGEAARDEVMIYIKDNGVGFDQQYAHQLYGVFQRLHSTREFEGTGIGLANVKRIILRHGGRVWAEGKVDEGATFYFSLPRTVPEG
ncbi:sensor histidine kinase [Nitrosomonas sp. Is37]|uniref:sensor histidine kinase n=1 Tax=Nitrosomonas sp. Is37 TaxID=3080535 RepID=UPI00294AB8A4|nr:ATP-binding protein [Nitrosomonas sp. Is37]MDV6345706.1 ATP-binding protein [Nitrosomonas sp. Is37]